MSDRYLRAALFGPAHPRTSGRAGVPGAGDGQDTALPGFGPFGTAGAHVFDTNHAAYVRVAALTALRRAFPTLRYGRQYLRPLRLPGRGFDVHGPGELAAWSRVLDDEEVLCVLNAHGTARRGGDVVVDAKLNPVGGEMTLVLNTAQAARGTGYGGTHPVGSKLATQRLPDGTTYVEIRDVGPSEVLVLTNHPTADEGAVVP
jgi:hypothetical protein